jgi:hypothetical protein
MATRKTGKKKTKLKKTAAKKPLKPKKTAKKKLAKKAAPKKKLAKKKSLARKPAVKTKARATKKNGARAAASRKQFQRGSQSTSLEFFGTEEVKARPAGQSGSLQGLSNSASADSESVDELIEEGNAFEGGVVSGVEAADNADEQEVHTHEVPEDDVPEEYLDED